MANIQFLLCCYSKHFFVMASKRFFDRAKHFFLVTPSIPLVSCRAFFPCHSERSEESKSMDASLRYASFSMTKREMHFIQHDKTESVIPSTSFVSFRA